MAALEHRMGTATLDLGDAEARIVAATAGSPRRTWTATEIVDRTGLSTTTALIALASLTFVGVLERPEPAHYRWTGADPAIAARDRRRRALGEH